MSDVLLVNPGENSPYPAMGLAELAAFIRYYGYSVKIIDFSLPGTSETDVLNSKAEIVGISVPCGLVAKSLALANYVKKNMRSTVVFGGYYPTLCTDGCMENEDVDFVVIGEGELPFLKLLDFLHKSEGSLRKISGIAYKHKKSGKIFINKNRVCIDNLDSLPAPAFDLLNIGGYPRKDRGNITATISTGRGCPFGCVFCSQSAFWERKVRHKSPGKIFQTVDVLMKKHPINYVRILDDIFPIRPKEALEIAEGLKERNLLWECQARIDVVNENLIGKLAKTNLDRVFFGIESGSPKIQEFIGKKFNRETIRAIISTVRRKGIKTKASFQLGFPGETIEDIELTIALAKTLEIDEIALFLSTPFPGTPLFRFAMERNLIRSYDPDDCDPSIASMDTGYLRAEEIEKEALRFLEKVPRANWGHHSEKGRKLRKLV